MCDIDESLRDKECRDLSRTYGEEHVVFAGCDVPDEDQFKSKHMTLIYSLYILQADDTIV